MTSSTNAGAFPNVYAALSVNAMSRRGRAPRGRSTVHTLLSNKRNGSCSRRSFQKRSGTLALRIFSCHDYIYTFYRKHTKKAVSRGVEIKTLFLGDSITEAYRGTSYGKDCTTAGSGDDDKANATAPGRCAGIPYVFRKLFDPSSTLALAISGDQTQATTINLQ